MTGFRFIQGLAFFILAVGTASGAEQVFQWKVSEGGNDHYYTAVAGDTWHEAEAAAVALGGHLVTINSEPEEDWLVDTFGPITEDFDENSFWIGLSDESEEGVWRWSSGEPVTHTNWGLNEPSGSPHSFEDYVYIGRYADATWNDVWPAGEGGFLSRGVAEVVPEPATLSLIGLGGVMALIRRRKQ